jgi:hypothetical protein
MDVQADQAGLGSDPYGTIASRPGRGQGRLFSDSVDTATSYGDTDQLPAVPGGAVRGGGGPRVLTVAVVVVALAVVAAAAVLGLVKSGVIDTNSKPTSGSSAPATTAPHHAARSAPTKTKSLVVSQTGTGAGSATYNIPVPAYAVTVTTTTGRSWVSVGAVGEHPVFAGILNPDSSQREILLGPSEVDVGAGGTSVTITSGKHSTTLKPPSAPFSYHFTTTSASH